MPLPVHDKQSDIPKGLEDLYEEGDDKKWHPIDQGAKAKKALDDERDARKAAEKLAKKAAEDLKAKDEELAAAKAGVGEDKLKQIRAEADAAAEKKLADKLKAAEEAAAAATGENRTLKLNRAVQEQFAAAGVLPERLGDLWSLKSGDFDLDEAGKPIVKNDAKKDLKKHVAEIVKGYPEWVKGTNASGGGAAGNMAGAAGGAAAADQVGKGNPVDRLRAAHEAGATA